jgi:hypothetical protein
MGRFNNMHIDDRLFNYCTHISEIPHMSVTLVPLPMHIIQYYVEMALTVNIYVSCNVIDYEEHKKIYANHFARV